MNFGFAKGPALRRCQSTARESGRAAGQPGSKTVRAELVAHLRRERILLLAVVELLVRRGSYLLVAARLADRTENWELSQLKAAEKCRQTTKSLKLEACFLQKESLAAGFKWLKLQIGMNFATVPAVDLQTCLLVAATS